MHPQSPSDEQELESGTHWLALLLQTWPAGQEVPLPHSRQPDAPWMQVRISVPTQRVAPSFSQVSTHPPACTHSLPTQTSPLQAGPQSASELQLGGIAPVHLHSPATQPQPQPQSSFAEHWSVWAMHWVPEELQTWSWGQALGAPHCRQPGVLSSQVCSALPMQRVAPG